MGIVYQFTELYKTKGFLLFFLLSLVFVLSCGGDDEEETTADNPQEAAYQAALERANTGATGDTLDTSATLESAKPVTTPEPIVIKSKDEAQLLLWQHLTTCRRMDTPEITSHMLENNSGEKEYHLYPSATAKNEFGVWKINEIKGVLVPQNAVATSWDEWVTSGLEDTVSKKCDSILEKDIPSQFVEPLVKQDRDAAVIVWTYLSKCYPDLQTQYLTPNTNAAEGGFVVKSSANSKTDHGLWNVKVDGTLSPMNAKAQERDSEITSGQCKNLIKSETEAISAVWAYIVKCNPLLDINDLDSNWDPKEDDWVVITKKSAQTRISNPEPDHGIWRVTRDAQITADNVTAQTEKIRADQGTEKC